MTRIAILLGGNIGDVEARFAEAERLVGERVGAIVARSSCHNTPSWGFESKSPFLNRCIVVESQMPPHSLLNTLQQIEQELGRDREAELREKRRSGERYLSRTIDLDVLLYGRSHIVSERLTVPHALLLERDFALVPLCEALGCTRDEVVELIRRVEEEKDDDTKCKI